MQGKRVFIAEYLWEHNSNLNFRRLSTDSQLKKFILVLQLPLEYKEGKKIKIDKENFYSRTTRRQTNYPNVSFPHFITIKIKI